MISWIPSTLNTILILNALHYIATTKVFILDDSTELPFGEDRLGAGFWNGSKERIQVFKTGGVKYRLGRIIWCSPPVSFVWER